MNTFNQMFQRKISDIHIIGVGGRECPEGKRGSGVQDEV